MLGSPAGPGGASQRGLWPLAPAPSANTFSTDALSKYGVYSLFPGNPGFGSALYSHASIGRFASGHLQQTSANSFHTHKVSDSLFSTTGYTFGAPTPPPGSPYSPIPVAQLELLTKGYNNNIIIQPQEYPSSPKKVQIQEKRCDEKCCSSLKQKTCNCPVSPIKSASVKYNETLTLATGCSRTNPIDWNGVNVKKEPGTPCQVAEVTTSVSPIVKLEVTSPTQKAAEQANVINNSIIGPTEPASASMATTSGCNPMGGAILQCTDDRSTGLGGWQMGNAHSSALATPTVWQYPAPIPMEPMVPVPTMPHAGFQLIRDPTSGGLLLLPTTTGLEPLQQAVVWPSYPQPPSVLLPSLQPPPLQLLSSASDYLSSSTTLHQHTQTHSTRLVAVTTDAKRKIPMPIPATTLIKIETDATTLDQTKTLQATPTTETTCRSQATSPVACLTPPPDGVQIQEEEATSVQDASNQTDTPICSEDDNTTHTVSDVIGEPKEKMEEADVPEEQMEAPKEPEPMPEQAQVPLEPEPRVETPKPVIEEIEETKEVQKPDLSGLELLSNSIVEFERNIQVEPEEEAKEDNKIEEKKTEEPLGGLDLLCALAEQRIMEEESTEVPPQKKSKERREKRREKRKSKKHSSDEPRRKKMKSERRRDEKKHREKRDSEKCDCQKDFRLYKTPETEEEVKKFIASKCQNQCCKAEWPHINPLELDMRMKLADLQRQYREKQKELNKLKPKKHHDCSKKKSRKKSTHSDRSLTPPPLLDKIDPVKPKNVPELLKPPTLCPYESLTPEKRPQTPSDVESSSSSSKKRKVGRPKKLLSSSGYQVATETIVAKKPKTNLVGYLLAAKEKLQLQNKIFNSPPRYLDETIPHKTKKARTINNNEIEKPKIGPKLKAEPMVKTYVDDWEYEAETEDIDEDEIEENQIENSLVEDVKPEDTRCTLTAELLEVDKLRVLTAMGGLFYAGHLNALEPPDVYSITLDGERGNKPHIMSREEILRDAIVEVSPKSTDDLPVGTRLCAYWSQQYRCLYPGSVAEPGTPDPHLDGKFVSVEFDDGDSGRIALEDIRFLPPDYPMIEYDPNPLLSLSKRRRRASTSISTEERRSSWSTNTESQSDRQSFEIEKENKDVNKVDVEPDYKETKKRLKKKKKEKMKDHEDKKKKKKHKCVEENCKHKKHHKKHKKHKKHHDKEREVEEIKPPVEEVIEEPEEQYPEYHVIANPDDEVTMDDIIESESVQNAKKIRNRQESCESRSKISAFLPANQLWGWAGKGYKRQRAKGRSKKSFYRSIQRGKELITVGDSAVFLSTGRPDRPYIGRIEAMWELCGTMVVRVKWFYHPEETVGCPLNLQYPGALFESPHVDENDVQTISHKCEVLPLKDYRERLGNDPQRYATIYDNNDIYYLAGYYDPTCTQLTMEPGIPFGKDE